MCCQNMFDKGVYTFMGKCFSTHGQRMFQDSPGSTGGLKIIAKSSPARKLKYQHYTYNTFNSSKITH